MDTNNVNFVSGKRNLLRKSGGANNSVFQAVDSYREELMKYDDVMVKWLNADEAHKEQFMKNPAATFEKIAKPDSKVLETLKQSSQFNAEDLKEHLNEYSAKSMALLGGGEAVSDVISTNSWDMVASITQKEFNRILDIAYSKNLFPTKLDYNLDINVWGMHVQSRIEGKFGVPSLVGGTGSNIDIKIPIINGTVTKPDKQTINIEEKGQNSYIVITMNLTCIETERSGEKVYTYYMLINDGAIVNVKVYGLSEEIEKLGGTFFSTSVKDAWVKEGNGKQIKICEISADSIAAEYKFLVPSYVRYIFTENIESSDKNVLSILVLTLSRKTENLPYKVDKIIPEDCECGVLLDNKLFLQNVILPAIAKSCDTETSKFQIKNDGNGHLIIENKEQFNYKKVNEYTPKVTKLTVGEYDGKLHFNLEAVVTPTDGINLKYYADATYSLQVKDGENASQQKLEFKKETFNTNHKVDIEWWVWTIAAATAVAGLFVGGPLIAVIVGALSNGIVGIVGSVIDNAAPSLKDSVFLGAALTVKWEYASYVKFEKINLLGDIQLGLQIPIQK